MNRGLWPPLVATAGALIFFAMTSADRAETCCFTHPSYRGTCEVVPAEDETCESILRYLNTPTSQGKNYCGGTELRGGWKQVTCAEQ